MKILKISIPILLLAFLILSNGCRKEISNDPSLKLEFSTDTLTFDTVFTTLGSTTLPFKVFNRNKNAVEISSVRLVGGNTSQFRINVDGIAGPEHEKVLVYGKDSIWVFVEVTVDTMNRNNPFVLYDQVEFVTNGNTQQVVLEAWGQDAHFLRDSIFCDQTWVNDRPYVILNGAAVDSGCVLNIEAGTQVYMGGNAKLVVFGTGKINVNGTKDDPVVFQGIRLESFYDDLPGQWSGIFLLRSSTGNVFNYAVVKNSDYGINLGSVPNQLNNIDDILANYSFQNAPEAEIKNTIIQNSFYNAIGGLLALVTAENCLLFNSGDHVVSLGFGGVYDFTHCTIVNYGSASVNHESPCLFMSNVLVINDQPIPADLIANFENNIIYGSLEDEIKFSDVMDSSVLFDYLFDHCLLKTKLQDTTDKLDAIIFNEDPKFTDRTKDDYTLSDGSPCIDAGKQTSVTTDLAGEMRDGMPDLGAYEYMP